MDLISIEWKKESLAIDLPLHLVGGPNEET